MAKKEKVQLTPEELAEKKLNTRKGWAICMKASWKRTQMRKSPVPGSISRPAF